MEKSQTWMPKTLACHPRFILDTYFSSNIMTIKLIMDSSTCLKTASAMPVAHSNAFCLFHDPVLVAIEFNQLGGSAHAHVNMQTTPIVLLSIFRRTDLCSHFLSLLFKRQWPDCQRHAVTERNLLLP